MKSTLANSMKFLLVKTFLAVCKGDISFENYGLHLSSSSSLSIVAVDDSKLEGSTLGSTPFDFEVTRTGATSVSESVKYQVNSEDINLDVRDFSFQQGLDQVLGTLPSGTVNFAAGEASKNITILILADFNKELDEKFSVSVSDDDFVTKATASAIIITDDDPTYYLTPTYINKAEGNNGVINPFTFTVLRTVDIHEPFTLYYNVFYSSVSRNPPIHLNDYVDAPKEGVPVRLMFAANEFSKTITLNVKGDFDEEEDDTFIIGLFEDPTQQSQGATCSGVIKNDDFPLVSIINNAPTTGLFGVLEGDTGTTIFSIALKRNVVTDEQLTIEYRVSTLGDDDELIFDTSFNALSGQADSADFVGGFFPSGTVSFGPLQEKVILTIPISGDKDPEPSFEVFKLTIFGDSLPRNQSELGFIFDDDISVTAVGPSAKLEGNSGVTEFIFTVKYSRGNTFLGILQYQVVGVDTDELDFVDGVFPAGTLTYAGYEDLKNITIPVMGDTDVESDETFVLIVSEASSSKSAQANGTILNDDIKGPQGVNFC